MPETTFEEAKRCPICEQPGAIAGAKPGPHGSQLHTIVCKNNRCRWYDTAYVVQVNADGTVPPPNTNRIKNFPKLPDRTEEVQASMLRLYEQSLSGWETR